MTGLPNTFNSVDDLKKVNGIGPKTLEDLRKDVTVSGSTTAAKPAAGAAKPTAAPVKPIEPVKPVAPVAPVKPIEPVKPVAPVAPVKPNEPVKRLKKWPIAKFPKTSSRKCNTIAS